MKRVVIISDTHCGHKTGLTPPEWETSKDKWSKMRKQFWGEFERIRAKLGRIDCLICNGDLIDGPSNTREGGIGALEPDRNIQSDMAVHIINQFNAKKIVVISGTQYHTGDREDWEEGIAKRVGAVAYSGHEWVNVNGVILDCKHKIGSSSIPHGVFTAPARSRLWNLIQAEAGVQPIAQIFVRSHVHTFVSGQDDRYLFVVTPALQGWSKYGALNIERKIDWGIVWFDIEDDGSYRMDYDIARIQAAKAKVVRI